MGEAWGRLSGSPPPPTTTQWWFSLSLPNGTYGRSVRAVDTVGKVDSTDAWVTFAVG